MLQEEIFSPELKSRCVDLITGRLLLIGASHRPEAGWFLGNELMRRTTASRAAVKAISSYFSEFGSCCEDQPLSCPSSVGSEECFELYPAKRWWEEHRAELQHFEPWREGLLNKAGLTPEKYHFGKYRNEQPQ